MWFPYKGDNIRNNLSVSQATHKSYFCMANAIVDVWMAKDIVDVCMANVIVDVCMEDNLNYGTYCMGNGIVNVWMANSQVV